MSKSCQPPSDSNNKERHALCTAASLFTRHHYHLTACTLWKVTFWTSIYHTSLYDIYIYIFIYNVALKLSFSWGQVKLSKAVARLHTNTVMCTHLVEVKDLLWPLLPAQTSSLDSLKLSAHTNTDRTGPRCFWNRRLCLLRRKWLNSVPGMCAYFCKYLNKCEIMWTYLILKQWHVVYRSTCSTRINPFHAPKFTI